MAAYVRGEAMAQQLRQKSEESRIGARRWGDTAGGYVQVTGQAICQTSVLSERVRCGCA